MAQNQNENLINSMAQITIGLFDLLGLLMNISNYSYGKNNYWITLFTWLLGYWLLGYLVIGLGYWIMWITYEYSRYLYLKLRLWQT